MSNPSDIVAVKVEGRTTEWYAPTYTDPYEDTPEFRTYFDKHMSAKTPLFCAPFGDADGECLSADLDRLLDRLADEVPSRRESLRSSLAWAIVAARATCTKRVVEMDGARFVMTPYAKKHLPPVNEMMLAETYGEFADLMRERIAAI